MLYVCVCVCLYNMNIIRKIYVYIILYIRFIWFCLLNSHDCLHYTCLYIYTYIPENVHECVLHFQVDNTIIWLSCLLHSRGTSFGNRRTAPPPSSQCLDRFNGTSAEKIGSVYFDWTCKCVHSPATRSLFATNAAAGPSP